LLWRWGHFRVFRQGRWPRQSGGSRQRGRCPIPKGIYYIIDRQSGGRLGALRDFWNAHGVGTTDHKKWFMLWNSKTGDSMIIDGIKRGTFRPLRWGRWG